MEEDLSDNVNWSPEYIQQLKEKYSNKEYPLFMESLPDNIEECEDLVALQSIMYNDQTPTERSLSLKEQGNMLFKDAITNEIFELKRKLLFECIQCYSKALEEKPEHNSIMTQLYNNRGLVYCTLGLYNDGLKDYKASLSYDDKNIKAYYRIAKVYLSLKLFSRALYYCNKGMELSPSSLDFVKLKNSIEIYIQSTNESKNKTQFSKSNLFSDKTKLFIDMIKKKGLIIRNNSTCFPNIKHPYVDDGILYWSCIFRYPEFEIFDIIIDFSETRTFMEQLEIMFPPESHSFPCDTEKKYRFNNLNLYGETPNDPNNILSIPTNTTILQFFQEIKEFNLIPSFWVLPLGSMFEKKFLSEHNIIKTN